MKELTFKAWLSPGRGLLATQRPYVYAIFCACGLASMCTYVAGALDRHFFRRSDAQLDITCREYAKHVKRAATSKFCELKEGLLKRYRRQDWGYLRTT